MTTHCPNPNSSPGHRNIYGQDNDIEANLLQNDIYLQDNNSQPRPAVKKLYFFIIL